MTKSRSEVVGRVAAVSWRVWMLSMAVAGCGNAGTGDHPGSGGDSSAGAASTTGGAAGSGGGPLAPTGPLAPAECRVPASVSHPGADPWQEFLPIWVDAICTNLAGCCEPFDAVGCRGHYSKLISGLSDGDPKHYAFDAAMADTCLAEIASQLAECRNGFGGSCTYIKRGLLRDGEACDGGGCASGGCGQSGVCGTGLRGKLGESCTLSCSLDTWGARSCWGQPTAPSRNECYREDGVFCALKGAALGPLDASGAHCEALKALGAPCQSGTECAEDYCSPSGVCGSKPAPEPRPGLGQPCEFVPGCADGLICRDGSCACGGSYGSYLMPIVCTY